MYHVLQLKGSVHQYVKSEIDVLRKEAVNVLKFVIIPRETEGYGVERVCPSVCPSVRPP